jgi:thioesterase domain-containing protein/acyl carrier protein
VQVLQIWKQTLNLAELGVEDDFFVVGGTSLLATSVMAEIQREFGVALPLSALLEAPTVRRLSELVSQRSATRDSSTLNLQCLVQLRPGPSTAPTFFFIHDGLGETLLYANLARRLPAGFRAFGLEPLRRLGVPLGHFSIDTMAEYYVAALQRVQPHGPYFLGGLCAGGTIAMEVAKQLTAAGERVSLVVLLDSAAPGTAKKTGSVRSRRLNSGRQTLQTLQQANSLSDTTRALGELGAKVLRTALYELKSQAEQKTIQAFYPLLRTLAGRDRPWPNWLPAWSVASLYSIAEAAYALAPGKYADQVLLVRATRGVGTDAPHIQRYEHEDLGWQSLVGDTLTIEDVDAGHSSMLQEPFVEQTAALVLDALSTQCSTTADSTKPGVAGHAS